MPEPQKTVYTLTLWMSGPPRYVSWAPAGPGTPANGWAFFGPRDARRATGMTCACERKSLVDSSSPDEPDVVPVNSVFLPLEHASAAAPLPTKIDAMTRQWWERIGLLLA